MPMRNWGAAALSLGRAAIKPGHLCRCAAFVQKDEALGIEVWLGVEPGTPPPGYVRAVLFGCMRRLFLRVTPWRWKNPCTTLGGGR